MNLLKKLFPMNEALHEELMGYNERQFYDFLTKGLDLSDRAAKRAAIKALRRKKWSIAYLQHEEVNRWIAESVAQRNPENVVYL